MVTVSIGCDDGGRDDGGGKMIAAVHDADAVRRIRTIKCVGDPSKALLEASDA
jgi:hypothetical protein